MQIEDFLDRFSGPSTAALSTKDKMLHWIAVLDNPKQHTEDHSPFAIAALRKNARQNLRRLALRNPQIAGEVMREVQSC